MIKQGETFKVKEVKDIVVISTMIDFTLSMKRTMKDDYQELCDNPYKKIMFAI